MTSMLIHQYCTAYQMQARDASKLQSASVWLFDNDFVWLHCAAMLFTRRDASTMECITRCDASSLQSASVASDREEDISSGARLLLLWASDGLYVILPEYGFQPQKIQHRHYITDTKSCAILSKSAKKLIFWWEISKKSDSLSLLGDFQLNFLGQFPFHIKDILCITLFIKLNMFIYSFFD